MGLYLVGGLVVSPCGFTLWDACRWPRGEEWLDSYRNLIMLAAPLGLPCGAELVDGFQSYPVRAFYGGVPGVFSV